MSQLPGPLPRGVALGLTRLGVDIASLAVHLPATLLAEVKAALSLPGAQSIDLVCPPWPPGLSTVHATWIEDALAGEPDDILAALSKDAPPVVQQAVQLLQASENHGHIDAMAQSTLVDLRWSVLGPLGTELSPPSRDTLAASLHAFPPDGLLDAIRRRGADELGRSLSGAPARVVARAMLALGAPWAGLTVQATGGGSGPRGTVDRAVRTRAQATVAASVDLPAVDALERLSVIGACATHQDLQDEGTIDHAAALGHRLPMSVGRWLIVPRKIEGTP